MLGLPWYTWAIAGPVIGLGVVLWLRSVLRKAKIDEQNAVNRGNYIKSRIREDEIRRQARDKMLEELEKSDSNTDLYDLS